MATDIPVTKNVTYTNGKSSTVTFEWAITGLRTKQEGMLADAVIQTFWTLTGTDTDGAQGIFTGATPFTTVNNAPDYQFVPFAELSETTVLGWIQDQVVGEYANHIMEQIMGRLEGQNSTVVEHMGTFPWTPKNTD
jgi:hypothetical protein